MKILPSKPPNSGAQVTREKKPNSRVRVALQAVAAEVILRLLELPQVAMEAMVVSLFIIEI